ncbi:hypothetical protein ACQSED_13015 [Salmonella enterica]|uniref:hypothetical protein n=1 Tax=Salmonella enterica TaxID=28901 RepID=UPI003D317D39
MKDINPSPEAVAKVEALIDELYDTCVMNDIPLVVGALVNRRATPRGEMVNRLLSVHLDGPAEITDSSLHAASEILRIREVPNEFIAALEMIREEMAAADICDCPECQADRERKH